MHAMKPLHFLVVVLLLPGSAWAQNTPPPAEPAAVVVQPAPATQSVQPAPATPQPAAATPSDDYADHRKGFDARLMLGASLRTISATRNYAGVVQGAFGGQIRHVAIHGEVGLEHGRTAFGLATTRFRFGPSVEGIIDRLRLGGGIDVVYTSFRRATRSDSVGAVALDLGAFALVDIVRFDGGAFIGGVRADLEFLLGVQVGGSLQLGARF